MSRESEEERRGPGRPALGDRVNISVALPGDLREWLDLQAETEGLKPSTLARRLIEDYRETVERSRGTALAEGSPAVIAAACPHCRGPLVPVRVVSTVPGSPLQRELLYSVEPSRRSRWTGRYRVDGTLKALGCQRCGSISLVARSD